MTVPIKKGSVAMALRILLVDDHILFRKGVAFLLSTHPEFEVVAEAGDGLEAIEQARQFMPDVIMMDIGMPRCNGLEATRLIKQEMPIIKIVILTVSDDDQNLFGAIKNGAEGYLLKSMEPDELFNMLAGISHGEAAITGALALKILNEFRQPEKSLDLPVEGHQELSPREIMVLEQVVAGATNQEIAETLCITENTVKIHLKNILEKLHLRNRIQAAVYAVRKGWVVD
jgi:DNA-binding NarL/FixJ family response regulator